jgi:hypothetical protein
MKLPGCFLCVLLGAVVVESAASSAETLTPKQSVQTDVAPALPANPSDPHRNRAVTQDDYRPLHEDTPGVDVGHVTVPGPVTGGSVPAVTTPARSAAPDSLRARERIVVPAAEKPGKSREPE